MTTRFKIFRVLAFLLTVLILCQSCNIYRTTNLSLEEAAETDVKVRLKTTSDRKYVFKRIEKNEDLIYGVANKNSKAAKELSNHILPESPMDNKVKIRLDELPIQEINPKNKRLSELVPLMIAGVALLIFGLTYEMSSPFGD